jgi:hypothetical protein
MSRTRLRADKLGRTCSAEVLASMSGHPGAQLQLALLQKLPLDCDISDHRNTTPSSTATRTRTVRDFTFLSSFLFGCWAPFFGFGLLLDLPGTSLTPCPMRRIPH